MDFVVCLYYIYLLNELEQKLPEDVTCSPEWVE